jgi:hypothetical protein
LNFGVFGNFPPVWHQLGEALVLVLDGTVELHDEDGLEHEPPTRACEELHDEGGLEHEPPARACEVRTAGEYVGDTCFFQRHGSLRVERHTASAATQVTLAVFSFVSLQRLADARPDLAVDIVTHAVQRMVQRALKGVLQPPPLKEAAEAMRVAAEAELAAKAAEAMRVAAEAELAAKAAEAMRVAAEAELAAKAAEAMPLKGVLHLAPEPRLALFRATQAASRWWTGFDETELAELARHMLVLQLEPEAAASLRQGACCAFVGVLAAGELELRDVRRWKSCES